MSFFSRSRSKGHYPKNSHGSGYYKRPHPSGILGTILSLLMGRKGHSRSYSDRHHDHYSHRHRRKSSWS